MPDGASVSVARLDGRTPDAPVLTVFHGLEGSVRSTYAQGLMHQARARGWGAALLLFRTCDGRIPERPRLYHSGETQDAGAFFHRLITERPGRPIVATGISLGANVLCKWLGEQGGTGADGDPPCRGDLHAVRPWGREPASRARVLTGLRLALRAHPATESIGDTGTPSIAAGRCGAGGGLTDLLGVR